jgi:hypothetical protein
MNVDLKGFFELIRDLFTNDKYMRRFLRVFFTLLLGLILAYPLWSWLRFEWVTAHGIHDKLWGDERNIPKPEKKIVYEKVHDTFYLPSKPPRVVSPINVKSDHQSGGQTAGSIINNPPHK